MSTPQHTETRYATVGGADVAYRTMGDGPFDVLYFYGLGSHVDMGTDAHAPDSRLLYELAALSRLTFFDRRGTGASDHLSGEAMPAWEEWADDVRAVLDAAGSASTAIIAALDAGPIALMFAALEPERVTALALMNTSARYLEAPDYPIGIPRAVVEGLVQAMIETWGTEAFFPQHMNPGLAGRTDYLRAAAKQLRAAATPRNAAAQYRYILENMDVRGVLHLIQAPTLVLHTSQDPVVPIEHGRYLAAHIPGARFVEVPGTSLMFDDHRGRHRLFEELAEFLTGERPVVEVDRVLTTVLFTDIVSSTEHLAALGDRRWKALLDDHDRLVRGELRRFRGREVKTTGDGVLACFDGPGRAIGCATSIAHGASELGVEVRAGMHTGECEVRGDDLAGLAVHIAARIGALAGAGEVLVSTTVKDLVAGSGIGFLDRGEHELKGIPRAWRLFAVADSGQ